MRAFVAACAVMPLFLAACGQGSPPTSSDEASTSVDARQLSQAPGKPSADGATKAKATAATAAGEAPLPVLPMLAYAYSFRLELPADKARGLLARHQEACENAGPALCQVVAANSNAEGRDQASGQLQIRAQPAWLKAFRARLGTDANGAGGKVLSETTETEDLTRSMVDTEAAIRSATVMETRLERLLAERPGDLQDALQLEQELARVRGTIDATRSALEVMRGRVAMAKLTVDYVSSGVAAPDGVGSPVKQAVDNFLRNLVLALAGLINLVSFLLIPALVVAVSVWAVLRWRTRRSAARAAAINLERGSA